MRCDADVLDQRARSALRTQSRQETKLQATDHGAALVFRDHQVDIWMAGDAVESLAITWRERIPHPLAAAAKRVVGQHCHDGRDIAAAGRPDRDTRTSAHDVLE